MIPLPRVQIIAFAGFVVASCALCAYVTVPLGVRAARIAGGIRAAYRTSAAEELAKLERKQAALYKTLAGVDTLSTHGNTAVRWYGFIQQCVDSAGIHANRITASPPASAGQLAYVDYQFAFTATYHGIGMLVGLLENGPFVCAVEHLKLGAGSLLSNDLGGSVTVRFYRSAR